MKYSHLSLLLATFALSALPAAAAPVDGPDIDFAGLGEGYQKAHCPEGSSDGCDLEDILAIDYVHIVVGAFEVHFPIASLKDKANARNFQEVLEALVDLQKAWIDLLAGDRESSTAAQADLELMRNWFGDWKTGALAKVSVEKADLFEHLDASDDVRAAAERLQEYVHSEEELGLVIPDEDDFVQVLCCPKRLDFMQLVGFAGLKSETEKEQYWVDGVHEWTQMWVGWTFALALEYAPWGGFQPSFSQGLDMTKFEKTGLSEHVIQRCTMALFRYCRPGYDPGHLGTATALAMAIDICGQVKTIDGVGARGSSGATTQAYERFVPGGASSGGVLPMMPAAPFSAMVENHWRRGGGTDYFSAPLRKGQKQGAKRIKKDNKDHPLVRNKGAHFMLEGYKTAGRHVVSAPFLGETANDKDFPDSDFMIDYREFFRSYKTSFFRWLLLNGVEDSEEESLARYRQLLRRYGEVDDEVGLHEVVESVYSTPLSAVDGESVSLEWRYLDWLQKGK
ncbi:MAG: hypothetical protein ACI8QZ_002187 [Chlamydiales bacterium]|jgi:hypothetical protein